MSDDAVLAAALEYADHGLYVFPVRLGVRGNGKKDVRPIDSWKEASTTDPEQITKWWTNGWAGAALAIDTGKSGIVVVDQDVSDGKRGPENWEILGERSEFRVHTPSGGLHDYYLADPERPVSVANRGEVADGVDVRGDGGFVFAPPTADPRGGAWTWEIEPDGFSELPTVPLVVPDRIDAVRGTLRPKPAAPSEPVSQLFASPSQLGMNGKRKSDAQKLVTEELEAFRALKQAGSGRSHILAQRLGVLAGHGVDVFWGYQEAMDTLMQACVENGFTAEHGDRYAEDQARRGLEYGMREPWTPLPELETPEVPAAPVRSLKSQLLGLDDLLAMPLPDPLIKGVLDLESATWLIAQPGGFKSFVALDWACHVATGKDWRDRKVRQAPVVYVLAEGRGNFRKRVQAWMNRNEARPEALSVLPVAVQARGKDKTQLSDAWRELVELVKEIQPGLIVLDTQARLTVGMEENNNTEMGVWVSAVDALKEATKACVLVVHHTGRNGGDARGGSALDGAQDAEWRVDRKAHKLAMTLSCDKSKDGDDRTSIDFEMDSVEVGVDEDGAILTSLVLGKSRERTVWTDAQGQEGEEGLEALLARGGSVRCRDLVLSLVRSLDAGQGLARNEIQRLGNEALKQHPSKDRAVKYAEASYRAALKELVKSGELEAIGGNRNTVYALPEVLD